MNPKISVITISYNAEKTIEDTINSVLSQNYNNLEYIIIDGGSTDKTVEIIKKYESKITYWVSEKDNGISDAFNKGIKVATGDIVGIINSDDQYLPGALKAIANNYEENIDVYRGIELLYDSLNDVQYEYKPSMKFRVIPIKINVTHSATFVSKKAYEKYGVFDTNFKIAMDLDLLRRFYWKGAKFKKVDFVLSRFNSGGISTMDVEKGDKEREEIVLKNGGSFFYLIVYKLWKILTRIIKKIFKFIRLDYKKIRLK